MLNNKKTIFFYIIAAICLVIIVLYGINTLNKRDSLKTSKKVTVVTDFVKETDFYDKIEVIGTALSNRSVDISSNISRKVKKVLFKDGQQVSKNDLLVILDSDKEEAVKKKLEVEFQKHEREFNRLHSLKKNGVISDKEYERMRSKMLTAKTDLDIINTSLAETKITAPFSGFVGMTNLHKGAFVKSGQVITTLDDIRKIKSDFYIPEKYSSSIKEGDLIIVESEVYPQQKLNGIVQAISTRTEQNTHNIHIRGIIDNTDKILRPGMMIKASIIYSHRNSPAINEKAIIYEGQKTFIFIVNDKKIVYKTPVKVGSSIDGMAEILDGTTIGDRYVVEGGQSLKNKQEINY